MKFDRKVILPPETLKRINYLVKKDSTISLEYNLSTNKMPVKNFLILTEKIINNSKITIQNIPPKNNEINYDISLICSLSQKYKELYKKIKITSNEEEINKLFELIDLIYEIEIEIRNYYLLRDLISAKEDCLKNMEYFLDSENISKFNIEYEQAINNKDTKKMNDMLNYVQEKILKEWENYFINFKTMNDDNFSFIGHSTAAYDFNNNFFSRFVSSSLFTQDLTDTYRNGYGFVFAPKNIVGAKSDDMYANNYAKDEEFLLPYSCIKKIDHPQRLIDECIKLKQDNSQTKEYKKIYNEVILDGFEPIAIFCFTDGTKRINPNYRQAEHLQKDFPNLKIYAFDIMKRKKDAELDEIKLNLINNLAINKLIKDGIKDSVGKDYIRIPESSLSQYDYFFKEYEKLKQKQEFNDEEIEIIFQKNCEFLSYNLSLKELFNGKYKEQEIKYILRKNQLYDFDNILSGRTDLYNLENLKELYAYKEKLNLIYDGISDFLSLLMKINITEELIMKINNQKPTNFKELSNILNNELTLHLYSNENINYYKIKYNEIKKEIQKRMIIEEQYKIYYEIYINGKVYAKFIKKDYQELIEEINETTKKEKKLQQKLNLNQEQITTNQNSKSIKKFKKISKIFNLFLLNKNKLKKELKLQELNKEINYELTYVQSIKNDLNTQLKTIKLKIKDYFNCDSVEDIDVNVSLATDFVEHYDYSNPIILTELNKQLNKIIKELEKQNYELNELNETKSSLRK